MLFMRSKSKIMFFAVLFCLQIVSGFAMEPGGEPNDNGQEQASWFSNLLQSAATYQLPSAEETQQLLNNTVETARGYGETVLPRLINFVQLAQDSIAGEQQVREQINEILEQVSAVREQVSPGVAEILQSVQAILPDVQVALLAGQGIQEETQEQINEILEQIRAVGTQASPGVASILQRVQAILVRGQQALAPRPEEEDVESAEEPDEPAANPIVDGACGGTAFA